MYTTCGCRRSLCSGWTVEFVVANTGGGLGDREDVGIEGRLRKVRVFRDYAGNIVPPLRYTEKKTHGFIVLSLT